jgi:hypothetical protein
VKDNGLEKAVRMLVDRQAILDCLVRYSRAVDRLDRTLALSVYHPDAIDDHGLFVGTPETFIDWAFEGSARNRVATHHIITNHSCELAGDVAHCETYYMLAAMNKRGTPLSMIGGRYIDRFERRDERWAIAVRKVLLDWHGIPGDFLLPPELMNELKGAGRSARDLSDVSYERPLTIDPARVGRNISLEIG